ncbi:hypothetical protein BRARA_I03332 [Brassica rapa]|uniref:Zinc knuckle CX2CX4HX4C domain-containing protein n=1 Tax=Brassica campestris TaxID=3711 RepID=A0A397Y0H1_BRACM|nr:hypothetical protein BRARA_I03332 [Brassica rapa]
MAIDKAIVKRLFFWFFFGDSRSFSSKFDLIVGWFTQVNPHDSSISVVENKLHHDEAVSDSYCYGWGFIYLHIFSSPIHKITSQILYTYRFDCSLAIMADNLRRAIQDLNLVMTVDFNPSVNAAVEFIRIRLNWNVGNPLKFQRNFQFSPGVNTLLKFRYERLKGFCDQCGMITHDSGECPPAPVVDQMNVNNEEEDPPNDQAGDEENLYCSYGYN